MFLRIIFLISAFIMLLSSSCSVKTKGALTNQHHLQEKTGTYSGVLPCTSCPGIKTSITIDAEGTYRVYRNYLDRDTSTFVETGTLFNTNKKNTLALKSEDHNTYIRIHNSAIQILDSKGQKITGELADHYTLKKQTDALSVDPIVELRSHRWQLDSITGFSTKEIKQTDRIPFIEFSADENRISGFAGCNNFFGTFQTTGQGKITIFQLASTKKYCQNTMNLEQTIINVLSRCKWFTVKNNILTLKDKEKNTMAFFTAK